MISSCDHCSHAQDLFVAACTQEATTRGFPGTSFVFRFQTSPLKDMGTRIAKARRTNAQREVCWSLLHICTYPQLTLGNCDAGHGRARPHHLKCATTTLLLPLLTLHPEPHREDAFKKIIGGVQGVRVRNEVLSEEVGWP